VYFDNGSEGAGHISDICSVAVSQPNDDGSLELALESLLQLDNNITFGMQDGMWNTKNITMYSASLKTNPTVIFRGGIDAYSPRTVQTALTIAAKDEIYICLTAEAADLTITQPCWKCRKNHVKGATCRAPRNQGGKGHEDYDAHPVEKEDDKTSPAIFRAYPMLQFVTEDANERGRRLSSHEGLGKGLGGKAPPAKVHFVTEGPSCVGLGKGLGGKRHREVLGDNIQGMQSGDSESEDDGPRKRGPGRPAHVQIDEESFRARCNQIPAPANAELCDEFGCTYGRVQTLKTKLGCGQKKEAAASLAERVRNITFDSLHSRWVREAADAPVLHRMTVAAGVKALSGELGVGVDSLRHRMKEVEFDPVHPYPLSHVEAMVRTILETHSSSAKLGTSFVEAKLRLPPFNAVVRVSRIRQALKRVHPHHYDRPRTPI
jgi:hypothetical protein